MKIFRDTAIEQPRIEKAIKKYGYAPEHNFWWYQAQADENSKNVYVEFNNDEGLFTIEETNKKRITIFSSPIAPPERRAEIIVEYLEHIFKFTQIEKVTLELESVLYKNFLKIIPSNLKARSINYTLTWPIYNLEAFNYLLPGKHWKTIRKEKNNFYNEYSVKFVDAKDYKDKEALYLIINEWRKKRGANDRAHFYPFINFISKNFKGAIEARVMLVNDKAVGINAGWLIPNSNRYYGSIGIHNYSFSNLGDMIYLEDLSWLKDRGYKEADMGGGEKELTAFKNKFLPKEFYKTHVFSVVKA